MRARRAFPGILDSPAFQTQPNCSMISRTLGEMRALRASRLTVELSCCPRVATGKGNFASEVALN